MHDHKRKGGSSTRFLSIVSVLPPSRLAATKKKKESGKKVPQALRLGLWPIMLMDSAAKLRVLVY